MAVLCDVSGIVYEGEGRHVIVRIVIQRLVKVGASEGEAEYGLAVHEAFVLVGNVAAFHQLIHGLSKKLGIYSQVVEFLETVADGDGDIAKAQLDRVGVLDLAEHVLCDLC